VFRAVAFLCVFAVGTLSLVVFGQTVLGWVGII
jgi:hypothetical protein